MKNFKRKAQRGFTLIELAIVGLFLGLLAIFAITQFSGGASDTARANSMYEAATKIADNWALLSMQCGTDSNISLTNFTLAKASQPSSVDTTVPGGTNASKNLAILLGDSSVTMHADWKNCWGSSGVKNLSGLAKGNHANGYSIYDYTLAVGEGSSNKKVIVRFSNVPESVIFPLYTKYSSASGASTATALPTALDNTDATIQFTAGSSGSPRDLTIQRGI